MKYLVDLVREWGDAHWLTTRAHTLTFEQVAVKANVFAEALTARNAAGRTVIIDSADPIVAAVALIGADASGATASLANPHHTRRERDAIKLAANAIAELRDTPSEGAIAIDCCRRTAYLSELPGDEKGATDSVICTFSSGSNGRLKGIVRTRPTLLMEGAAVASRLGLGPSTPVLCPVPMYHAYGLGMGLFASIAAGNKLILDSPRTPSQLLACLERSRPHTVVAVPALFHVWSRTNARKLEARILQTCISSCAPLDERTVHDFGRAWGRRVVRQYGMSECGAIAIDLSGNNDLDAVGDPYDGVRLVVDSSDAIPGEIQADTPWGARRYVDPSLPFPRGPDGFRTGDLGMRDARGTLRLLGRMTAQLNVHGQKVDPMEVESVLARHSAVKEVAVVGVPRRDGHVIMAYAAISRPVGEADLLAFCREQLASFKCPAHVVFVSAIPRSPLGKPLVMELRARAEEVVPA